jgi:hypothetical protein
MIFRQLMDNKQVYNIWVFSKISIAEILPNRLQADLAKVSFKTLCDQYGLDCSLIDQTLANLEVVSGGDVLPYWVVNYLPPDGRPLFVYYKSLSVKDSTRMFAEKLALKPNSCLAEELSDLSELYRIDLHPSQLQDMGLLLAYEVARWIGFHGRGLVRDLHGEWYALNQHQAFIPVSLED